MTIEGDYALFAHLETVYLGCLARRTLIMRNVREVVEAAAGKPILFFPARHDHWLVQTGDGWAAHVAGAIGVSTDAQASWWGGRGVGTVPHGLIAAYGGDTVAAARAFADRYAAEMNVTVLVDFDNDSVSTALEVADALGPRLWGVRLDTSDRLADASLAAPARGRRAHRRRPRAGPPHPPALDERGFRDVRIVVSGGFTADRIRAFEAEGVPVDAYGVGSSLIRGANDFTADVVMVDGAAARQGRPGASPERPARARRLSRRRAAHAASHAGVARARRAARAGSGACSATAARALGAQHDDGHDDRHEDQRGADQVGEVVAAVERGERPSRRRRAASLGPRRRQRRQHGEPERAADLHRRVDEAGGQARRRSAWRRTSTASSARGTRGRRRRRAGPSPAARGRRRCRRPGACVNSSRPATDQHEARQQRAAGAEARDQPLGVAQRQRAHHDRRRAGTRARSRARRSRARAAGRARRGRTSPNIPATTSAWIAFAPGHVARAEDAQRDQRLAARSPRAPGRRRAARARRPPRRERASPAPQPSLAAGSTIV